MATNSNVAQLSPTVSRFHLALTEGSTVETTVLHSSGFAGSDVLRRHCSVSSLPNERTEVCKVKTHFVMTSRCRHPVRRPLRLHHFRPSCIGPSDDTGYERRF